MYYQLRPVELPPALTTILALVDRDDAQRLESIFRFAAAAHAGQLRDEGTPFIDHPVAVVEILWNELGCRDLDVIAAALAHDILEDCDIEPEALQSLIGDRAYDLVGHVTKVKVADDEKTRRDDAYLASLRDAPEAARLLKLADRIHNLRAIPHAGDPEKARRYLSVSRAEFLPLATGTSPTAARLIEEACDEIEAYLAGLGDD